MVLLFLCSQVGGSDQLKAGEISLIETTTEETEAAKARLDNQRKKRKERHAKKKVLNYQVWL